MTEQCPPPEPPPGPPCNPDDRRRMEAVAVAAIHRYAERRDELIADASPFTRSFIAAIDESSKQRLSSLLLKEGLLPGPPIPTYMRTHPTMIVNSDSSVTALPSPLSPTEVPVAFSPARKPKLRPKLAAAEEAFRLPKVRRWFWPRWGHQGSH